MDVLGSEIKIEINTSGGQPLQPGDVKIIRGKSDASEKRKKICKLCSHVTTTDRELKKHVDSVHSFELKKLNEKKTGRETGTECKYCGLYFDKEAAYHDHARKEHLDQIYKDWLPCETCPNFFPNQTDLILHKNVSHAIKNEKSSNECQFCSEKFLNDAEYHKHASLIHADEIQGKWHPCERCSLQFPTSIVLSRHKVQNHFHQMIKKKKPLSKTERHKLLMREGFKRKQTMSSEISSSPVPEKVQIISSDQIPVDNEHYVFVMTEEGGTSHVIPVTDDQVAQISSIRVEDNYITFHIKEETS